MNQRPGAMDDGFGFEDIGVEGEGGGISSAADKVEEEEPAKSCRKSPIKI